jgi:hypothetical protein
MFKGHVDRIEGDVAVILLDDLDEIYLPLKGLPAGIKEGDALRLEVTIDRDATEKLRGEIAGIQDRLRKGGSA